MKAAIGWLQRNSGRSKNVPRFERHAGRLGRKAWQDGVVGGRGQKARSEDVLGRIAGGECQG